MFSYFIYADMKFFIDIQELTSILKENEFNFIINGCVLFLEEKDISDNPKYFLPKPYNSVYKAISRCKEIRILDFTRSENIPFYFYGFPFLEEVRIGEKAVLPIFRECPKLSKVSFSSHSIKSLNYHSFEGWPYIEKLELSENLHEISSFGNANISLIDLSHTKLQVLKEHMFQDCSFEKIILPKCIKVLPDYAFFGCKNLKEITGEGIEKVSYNALKNCPNLSYLKFNDKINSKHVEKLLNDKNSSDSYFLSRCGIIISNDDYFSYIWCFTDFKFYYTERLDDSFYLKVVYFYRSDKRVVNKVNNGTFFIKSSYTDFLAEDIQLEGFIATSKLYKTTSEYGHDIIDLQSKAIILYENLQKYYKEAIKQKTIEYDKLVNSLNIENIISSYKTTIIDHVTTKLGGDDRLDSEITRNTIYSDPYIDMLLPPFHRAYREYGYTIMCTSKEEKEMYKNEDEKIKENARKAYNKKQHIKCLVDNYVYQLKNNHVEIEEFLHIEFAKSIFQQIKEPLFGFDKIFKLNAIIKERKF